MTAHQGQIRPNSSHSACVTKQDKAAKPGPSQTTEQATHAALVGTFLHALLNQCPAMSPDHTIVKTVADNVQQLHWLFITSRAVGAVQPLTSPAQNNVIIHRHNKHFLVAGYKPYQALLHAGNDCRQIHLAAYPLQRIWHLMFQVQVCLNICLILSFSQTSRNT